MISSPARAVAAILSTAVAGGVLAAAPAHAADAYQGKVTANGGLTVRHLPTSASTAKGTVPRGQTVEIICKVRGTSVAGNDLWYALPPTLNEWVSARYVQNLGPAPRWCGSDERFVGHALTTLKKRAAPTRAAAQVGSVPRDATVDIVCKLPAQSVHGNRLWYSLVDGRWVSAHYVDNVGKAPGYCH